MLNFGDIEHTVCAFEQKKAKAHVVIAHLDGHFEFACPDCETVCNNRNALKVHLRKEHDKRIMIKHLDQFKREPQVAKPLQVARTTF